VLRKCCLHQRHFLTYVLTYSTEQSPSWETNRFSASQEIPRILWNTQFHYRIHKCPPPVPILSQLDPVPTKVSVLFRGRSSCFVTKKVFTVTSCQHLAEPPSWRTTPCRLSATAYSIYWQLPLIVEAIAPSATWRRAMPSWEGPTYHGFTSDTPFLKHSLKMAPTSVETRRSVSQTAWFGVWKVTHWVLVWCRQHKDEHNPQYRTVRATLRREFLCPCQRTVPVTGRLIASQYVCVLVEPWAANWFLFEWECSPYI